MSRMSARHGPLLLRGFHARSSSLYPDRSPPAAGHRAHGPAKLRPQGAADRRLVHAHLRRACRHDPGPGQRRTPRRGTAPCRRRWVAETASRDGRDAGARTTAGAAGSQGRGACRRLGALRWRGGVRVGCVCRLAARSPVGGAGARAAGKCSPRLGQGVGAALNQVGELLVQLADYTGLDRAADPAVFYMARSATQWVPTLSQHSAQQGLVGIRVLAIDIKD